MDNNNDSSEDEEPAADFPLAQDSQTCGTSNEVKMFATKSVPEKETEEVQSTEPRWLRGLIERILGVLNSLVDPQWV